MKMLTAMLICTFLVGCASSSSVPEQTLVLDKDVFPMSRSETIDAVKECETSGLRAIPIWGSRKINGARSVIVIEISYDPSYK
jgi:uncharacterized protein YcfL